MKSIFPVVALLNISAVSVAKAQSIWNATSGDWHTASNWTPAFVPASGMSALIGTTSDPRSVTISASDASASQLSIGASAGSQAVLTVTNGKRLGLNELSIGDFGNGRVNIQNGALLTISNYAVIGNSLAGNGEMVIDGPGSEFRHQGPSAFHVGYSGQGTLHISNSGRLTTSGVIFGVFSGSSSMLKIESGGRATGGLDFRRGTATITGAGSEWAAGSAAITVYSAAFEVLAGGSVSSAGSYINGPVTVSGALSSWNAGSGNQYIATAGNTTLTISDGGTVRGGPALIGATGGVDAAVVVQGDSSLWSVNGPLYVGLRTGSRATVTVEAGGEIRSDVVRLTHDDGSETGSINLKGGDGHRGVLEAARISEGGGTGGGFLNIDGGVIRASMTEPDFLQFFEMGDIQIGAGGAFFDSQSFDVGITAGLQGSGGLHKEGSGQLTLSGANAYLGTTVVESGELLVSGSVAGGVVVNSGAALTGSGTVSGMSLINGIHRPGNAVGIQQFSGPLTYGATSRLVCDFLQNSDVGGGSYVDWVNCTGACTVDAGASIDVVLNSGQSSVDVTLPFWSASHSWDVLTATGISGEFSISSITKDSQGHSVAPFGRFSFVRVGSAGRLVWSPATPYEKWKAAWFGEEWAALPLAADHADPNTNGLDNILEYAFGGNPTSATRELPLVVGMDGSSHLSLTFQRLVSRTDVTLTVEGSDGISGIWAPLAKSSNGGAFAQLIQGIAVQEAGTVDVRTVTVTDGRPVADGGGRRHFFRIKVEY